MRPDPTTNTCSCQEQVFEAPDRGTGTMTRMPVTAIEARRLRSALEFAVLMAREGRKFKPPLRSPKGLEKYFRMTRIPTASLGAIRRLVDGDDGFRTRIAAGALPELVDPVGKLWLERPDGWEDEARRLIVEIEAAEDAEGAANELRKVEKRRDAAEQVAARARAEIVVLHEQVAVRDATIEALTAEISELTRSGDIVRAELRDVRNELRHARDRETAALDRLRAADAERDMALAAQGHAEVVRDDVLADRAVLAAERSELARLASSAELLAHQLAALAVPPAAGEPSRLDRRPLPLPGGVLGDSRAAAEYLLSSGASVVVDGYNVAKLGWPDLDLAAQRTVLLDTIENLARRFGCEITVVFDGADVTGGSADRRRLARVVYSPADVIADDVIRDEVRRLPPRRQVVVVTNDREIVRDVRSHGANTMASEQLLALLR
jgi:predicted RNA-binding protein with PIN domain/uncharacterized coiled-coil protein SlyX